MTMIEDLTLNNLKNKTWEYLKRHPDYRSFNEKKAIESHTSIIKEINKSIARHKWTFECPMRDVFVYAKPNSTVVCILVRSTRDIDPIFVCKFQVKETLDEYVDHQAHYQSIGFLIANLIEGKSGTINRIHVLKSMAAMVVNNYWLYRSMEQRLLHHRYVVYDDEFCEQDSNANAFVEHLTLAQKITSDKSFYGRCRMLQPNAIKNLRRNPHAPLHLSHKSLFHANRLDIKQIAESAKIPTASRLYPCRLSEHVIKTVTEPVCSFLRTQDPSHSRFVITWDHQNSQPSYDYGLIVLRIFRDDVSQGKVLQIAIPHNVHHEYLFATSLSIATFIVQQVQRKLKINKNKFRLVCDDMPYTPSRKEQQRHINLLMKDCIRVFEGYIRVETLRCRMFDIAHLYSNHTYIKEFLACHEAACNPSIIGSNTRGEPKIKITIEDRSAQSQYV